MRSQRDDAALLAVVEDAVGDGTPSAVNAEVSRMSMVATRRLQLVAADADIPVLSCAADVIASKICLQNCLRPGHVGGSPVRRPNACASSERLGVAGVGRSRSHGSVAAKHF